MLSVLHIENVAVIEHADIVFDERCNVLTGETGAGKSIIIDSLGAVLGGRTSRDLIRSGSTKAVVSAVFYNSGKTSNELLSAWDLPISEEISVTREMMSDGRNICKVNGRPITVAQLKELGTHLVQIHGQSDNQSLALEEKHIDFLDAYGQIDVATFLEAYSAQKAIQKEINSLQMDENEKWRKIDMLQYRIEELDEADLQEGEEETLSEQKKLLKNAVKLTDAIETAYACLYGTEDSDGALSLLDISADALKSASSLSESMQKLGDKLLEVKYSADDCAEDLQALRSEIESSPMDINEVEARLDLIYKLRRKYAMNVEELITANEAWKEELDNIRFSGEKLEKLQVKLSAAEKKTASEAEKLTKKRQSSAKKLEAEITKEIHDLDMTKARLSVEVTDTSISSSGKDNVRFLFSANLGEPLKAISKIASGGELARIMLGIKNVLAQTDDVGTMVFDEVDAGVSGRAAQRVAEKLSDVAKGKQVLCVTHLPQIAAIADTHFRITKGVSGDRTVTTVDCLDYEGRVGEIARITGGSTITKVTSDSAAELIGQAAEYKKNRGS